MMTIRKEQRPLEEEAVMDRKTRIIMIIPYAFLAASALFCAWVFWGKW